MEHSITGGYLAHVCFDFRVELRLADTSDGSCGIALATPFSLIDFASTDSLVPHQLTRSDVERLLELRNRKVDQVGVHRGGRLEVHLSGGARIAIGADAQYEAWELHSDAEDLVCLPGGEVAVWRS